MNRSIVPTKAPKVTVTGRISSVECWPLKNPKRFTTLLRLAADDEYSTPATVEVVSEHSLGDEGALFTGEFTLGGRYRAYSVTDKLTGEQRTVRTADNVLSLV